jgi:hypothetical protein
MTTTHSRDYADEARAEFERRFAAGELSDKELLRLDLAQLIEYLDNANGDVEKRRAAVHGELVRRTRKKVEKAAAREAHERGEVDESS